MALIYSCGKENREAIVNKLTNWTRISEKMDSSSSSTLSSYLDAPLNRSLETSLTDDRLKAMLSQELIYNCHTDYLSLQENTTTNEKVNETWRRMICEWSYQLVDHFRFDREVVHISMNYLDRFIGHCLSNDNDKNVTSSPTNASIGVIDRRKFQLIAVTTLYVAIKLHGERENRRKPGLQMNIFVELSRGLFDVKNIQQMEMTLLSALQWRMNPPTSVAFVSHYLRYLPKQNSKSNTNTTGSTRHNNNNNNNSNCQFPNDNNNKIKGGIFDMARYFTELCVWRYSLAIRYPPSVIAFASILVAMESIDKKSHELPMSVREAFLKEIYRVVKLAPDMREVREVCQILKEVYPSNGDDGSMSNSNGSTSGVETEQRKSRGESDGSGSSSIDGSNAESNNATCSTDGNAQIQQHNNNGTNTSFGKRPVRMGRGGKMSPVSVAKEDVLRETP